MDGWLPRNTQCCRLFKNCTWNQNITIGIFSPFFLPIDVSQKLIRMHQVCTWFNRHKVCINAVKHYFQKWSAYTLNSNLLLLLFWTWLFSKSQFRVNSSAACNLCLHLTKLNFAWFTSLRDSRDDGYSMSVKPETSWCQWCSSRGEPLWLMEAKGRNKRKIKFLLQQNQINFYFLILFSKTIIILIIEVLLKIL